MSYIWDSSEWPKFKWYISALLPFISTCRRAQGYLESRTDMLNKREKELLRGKMLAEEAAQTTAVDNGKLDEEALRSSIDRHFSPTLRATGIGDQKVKGMIGILIDASENFKTPLTVERLVGWNSLMRGDAGGQGQDEGPWRTSPAPIMTRSADKAAVLFEGPPPASIPREIYMFFKWWKESLGKVDGLLRAGLAHLFFAEIRPFADGNGRIARALANLALAQDGNNGLQFFSLSKTIRSKRSTYYRVLEQTGKGGLDVTPWLMWFLQTLKEAIEDGARNLEGTMAKIKFLRACEDLDLNARQRKVLSKVLEAGPDGAESGLTTRQYVAITKTSRATAFREIDDLLSKKLLKPKPGGGRSTGYDIIKS